jgi:glycosyltransferase involved in cell wall biosynthesis
VQLRRLIAVNTPDTIIAFLENPSLLVELASLHNRLRIKLIVSERNDMLLQRPVKHWLRLQFHRRADAVVSNSAELSRSIRQLAPWLTSKLHTIPNCVDLDSFAPVDVSGRTRPGKILVVARFAAQKNPFKFLQALDLLRKQGVASGFIVHWYGNNFFANGRPTKFSECYLQVRKLIEETALHNVIELREPVEQVAGLYPGYDVFCLASLYEGCSNVIAEAMACGLPILASRIGGNDWLVEDGVNGFLFDPHAPHEIAATIRRYLELSHEHRAQMAKASRQRAQLLLSPATMVERYIRLIEPS